MGQRLLAALAGFAALMLGAPSLAQAPDPANPAARFNGTWSKQTPGFRYAGQPPYLPAAQARFDAEKPQDDPGSRCTESGTARIMISPYPMQFVAMKDHLLIVSEFNHVVRRIWTDGQRAPAAELDPQWYGNPQVRWEGETMVVDTIGYKAGNYIDPAGDLMSDQMHIVERWRLTDKDHLEIAFTFDDPKIYARPWSSVQVYARKADWRLGEFSCTENNRNNPDLIGNDKAFTSTAGAQAYHTTGPEGGKAP